MSATRPNPASRPTTPVLLNTPALSGKYDNFATYIRHAIDIAGTADQLGRLVGFTSGTRVSDWRRGRGGRPSIESCLRLAKLTGDTPLDVMTMAGYHEEVDLLREFGLDDKARPPTETALDLLQFKMKMYEARALFEEGMKRIEAREAGTPKGVV